MVSLRPRVSANVLRDHGLDDHGPHFRDPPDYVHALHDRGPRGHEEPAHGDHGPRGHEEHGHDDRGHAAVEGERRRPCAVEEEAASMAEFVGRSLALAKAAPQV